MILRKNRIHHTGASNKDFRVLNEPSETGQDVDRLEKLIQPKPKNFSETIYARTLRTAPDPNNNTKSLY